MNRWMAVAGRWIAMMIAFFVLAGTQAFAAAPGFDVEAASRAYIDILSGDELAKSNAYFVGGYWLMLWGAIIGVAVDYLFLKGRVTAKFRDWGEAFSKRRWIASWITFLLYALIGWIIILPWSIYTGFFRERQYDLMSQGFGAWAGEQLIDLAIDLVVTPLILLAIYAVIRRSPKRWWLWGTGVISLFLLIGFVVAPVFVSPLFNTYTEMEAGPLRDRIVALAQSENVPAEHIYVFDQSKQHKRISANVSGLGPTIRISLNDNLLNRTTEPEIVAVMGHELGHYVLGHVWRTVIILLAVLGLGLFLVSRIAPRLIAKHGEAWGIRDIADAASVPLLSALLTVYMTLVTPVFNTLIRVNESEADAFGLAVAKEPDGFAKVAMRLSEYRKIEPGPIEEFLFFDHPSGATRVRMSMQWKADNVPNPQIVTPPADLLKDD